MSSGRAERMARTVVVEMTGYILIEMVSVSVESVGASYNGVFCQSNCSCDGGKMTGRLFKESIYNSHVFLV